MRLYKNKTEKCCSGRRVLSERGYTKTKQRSHVTLPSTSAFLMMRWLTPLCDGFGGRRVPSRRGCTLYEFRSDGTFATQTVQQGQCRRRVGFLMLLVRSTTCPRTQRQCTTPISQPQHTLKLPWSPRARSGTADQISHDGATVSRRSKTTRRAQLRMHLLELGLGREKLHDSFHCDGTISGTRHVNEALVR